jgi:hypothetical protein
VSFPPFDCLSAYLVVFFAFSISLGGHCHISIALSIPNMVLLQEMGNLQFIFFFGGPTGLSSGYNDFTPRQTVIVS